MNREKAQEFWEEYDLPFDHDVAIKGRRSGLTRGSTGSGRDRSTVNHLYTEEEFTEGRLSRAEDSYLCDPNSAPSFELPEERYVEDGEKYIPPITCSRCLELMERWEK